MDSANRRGKYYTLPAGSPQGNPDWAPVTRNLNPSILTYCNLEER